MLTLNVTARQDSARLTRKPAAPNRDLVGTWFMGDTPAIRERGDSPSQAVTESQRLDLLAGWANLHVDSQRTKPQGFVKSHQLISTARQPCTGGCLLGIPLRGPTSLQRSALSQFTPAPPLFFRGGAPLFYRCSSAVGGESGKGRPQSEVALMSRPFPVSSHCVGIAAGRARHWTRVAVAGRACRWVLVGSG